MFSWIKAYFRHRKMMKNPELFQELLKRERPVTLTREELNLIKQSVSEARRLEQSKPVMPRRTEAKK